MAAIYLGDARAEQDYLKSKGVFYESPDYRTLIESDVKSIVVGRRGVGKSALYLRLNDYYEDADKVEVVRFAPEEHQVQAFRPIAKLFDDKFNLVRSAARLAFRYALLMEVATLLSMRFKFGQSEGAAVLTPHVARWRISNGLLSKLRAIVIDAVAGQSDAESRIGALAENLRLSEIEGALNTVIQDLSRRVVILVDRLDEGYEPDSIGVGIVDGFVLAAIDTRDKVDNARCIVFLRDNIYRAVEHYDQDFSRNLEQSVLRLHWDERGLLNFAANRLRSAAGIKAERSIRVWDSVTQGALQGELGFHHCLRLTLFRPRDLLLLLNDAFRIAAPRGNHSIDQADVDQAATSISESRTADLIKEYSAHLPGLDKLVRAFSSGSPSLSLVQAKEIISDVLCREFEDPRVTQQFEIFSDSSEALRALYSVGYLGIKEIDSSNYVFCHDGRKPDRDFSAADRLMVHPCYWMALNLSPQEIDESTVSQIYDEYDVTVTSETPDQRNRSIGRLESELREIEPGLEGAGAFERWCLKAIKVLFSGGLRNLELHPNKSNLQRRDIVGTNHGLTKFWKRILEDYKSRQVIFEVKNFASMTREQFWQINSYLCQDYGNIGFIITRDEDINLKKDRELAWIRELKNQHSKIVLLVPAKYLVTLLYKVRNPAKHDAGDVALDGLLDTYVRTYFGESAPSGRRKKR